MLKMYIDMIRWLLLALLANPAINQQIKIVSEMRQITSDMAWDCHPIHGNNIGLLLTAATKYLH